MTRDGVATFGSLSVLNVSSAAFLLFSSPAVLPAASAPLLVLALPPRRAKLRAQPGLNPKPK